MVILFLQRFGTALVPWGQLSLKSKQYTTDFEPIDKDCRCGTCQKYSRAYLHSLVAGKETVGCHLITIHNIAYQVRLLCDWKLCNQIFTD